MASILKRSGSARLFLLAAVAAANVYFNAGALAFDCPAEFGRRAASVDCIDNHDGTVTFAVTFAGRTGLRFYVK